MWRALCREVSEGMRTLILFVAVILCLAGNTSAQTPIRPAQTAAAPSAAPDADAATVTALAAILRGDYARAVELLSPLVENWAENVHAPAALFLGMLYERGLGVPQNPTRACALYARGEAGGGPLGEVAGQLMRTHLDTASVGLECQLLANVGINNGFTPALFSLDNDHWVSIDLDLKKQDVEAAVSYQGKEQHVRLDAPMSTGAVFLPIQYTALDLAQTRRHFIEIAAWLPQSESQWALQWSLTEIMQAEVTKVASETLTTFEGAMPPTDVSVELRELVTLRVNESGSAEFVIGDGPDARREGIPTLAERRETASEETRRKSAAEKVDWKRRRDPERAPSLNYADADGCDDLLIHAWSSDHTETLAIRADRDLLQLSTKPRVIDLATMPADFEVIADVFDRPQGQRFCTDAIAIPEGTRQETWRAVAGTVSIQLSEPGIRARNPQQYRATIQIDNAEFLGPTGATVKAPRPIRLTAVAGQLGYVEEQATLTAR